MKTTFQKIINSKVVAVTLIFSFMIMFIPETHAAALTSISDELSRLREGTAADHTIKFTTPSGIQNGDTITLTFPSSSFTMGASLSGVTIADGAGADNAVTSASWSAPTLTITASATSTVGLGNIATIKIPSAQITNPTGISSDTSYVVSIAGTFADTGSFAVVILENTDGTIDQVSMSGTVDPSITFSLSAGTSSFGTFVVDTVDTADTNITLTIGTNAAGGYLVQVRDTGGGGNPGLYSSATSSMIGSADNSYTDTANLTSASAGYGLQVACTAGCTTGTHVASDFRQAGDTVGGLESALSKNVITYGSALSAAHTAVVTHKAKISSWTPAGSYTDTITYIASGNF